MNLIYCIKSYFVLIINNIIQPLDLLSNIKAYIGIKIIAPVNK